MLNEPIARPTAAVPPPSGPEAKSGVASSSTPAAVKYARSDSVSVTNARVSSGSLMRARLGL